MFTRSDTIVSMAHEGERIKQLLMAIGKTPADLARASGVSRTAVDRYLKAPEIKKIAWLTVRKGLVKLHIEPRKVKPDDQVESEVELDLRPLIHDFSRDQLERLKTILEADIGPRERLAYFVDGALHPRK